MHELGFAQTKLINYTDAKRASNREENYLNATGALLPQDLWSNPTNTGGEPRNATVGALETTVPMGTH